MLRRIFAPNLRPGSIELTESEAHHARDVLRLKLADQVELFDEAGSTALGAIAVIERKRVAVQAGDVLPPPRTTAISIYSALPKGERADWMIEKLSELGVTSFTPILTARSVVEAPRANKIERWKRIAVESAKQSSRIGVMQINPERPLSEAITQVGGRGFVLTTQGEAQPLASIRSDFDGAKLFIGPEGGWTDDELSMMRSAGLTAARLTGTILRVETAAVAAAAVVASAAVSDTQS